MSFVFCVVLWSWTTFKSARAAPACDVFFEVSVSRSKVVFFSMILYHDMIDYSSRGVFKILSRRLRNNWAFGTWSKDLPAHFYRPTSSIFNWRAIVWQGASCSKTDIQLLLNIDLKKKEKRRSYNKEIMLIMIKEISQSSMCFYCCFVVKCYYYY